MKRTLSLFEAVAFVVCLQSIGYGQIPNAGFESWTGSEPNEWTTSNSPAGITITSTLTAHGGTSAARGDVVSIVGTIYVIQPVLQSGQVARGFPYTQRPASFTGYYEFVPAGSSGDRFGINVELFKGGVDGTLVGIAAAALATSVPSYAQFTASFDYLTTDTPDTCVIQILIVGPGTGAQATPHVGSYFLLDDIAFTGISSVASWRTSVPTSLQLDQNYPNPFNPTTNISFTVPADGKAKLTVFNLLGQLVGTLFNGPVSSGKLYRATFNASELPSGVYFSRLDFTPSGTTSRSVELMRKMTLIR
jgi:hypothetical protein